MPKELVDTLVLFIAGFLAIVDVVMFVWTIFTQELAPKDKLVVFFIIIIVALPLGRCLKIW